MAATLEPLREALAALSDVSLRHVRQAAVRECCGAPGFAAWVVQAIDWEASRRSGDPRVLLFPEELVPLHEFGGGARRTLDAITASLASASGLAALHPLIQALGALVARGEGYRQP